MLFARRNAIAEIPTLGRELDVLLLQPLFRKYLVRPPQIVHYTSVETLGAILSSGNLRMMHFRNLNDSTEMLHGRRVANEVMTAEVERDDAGSSFFDYSRFLFNKVDDTAIQYFVTSFSVLPDSPELWARYAVSGAGVAITFDVSRMGAEASEPFPYHVGRVTYTQPDQLRLISPLVEAAKTVLIRYSSRYGYDVRDIAVQMLAAKLCSHLNHHSISLKNEEWRDEREWRTVFSVLCNESDQRKSRIKLGSDRRPYVDVPVLTAEPDDTRLPIVSVTSGPSADAVKIRHILDQCGYSYVTIRQSAVGAVGTPRWPTGVSRD